MKLVYNTSHDISKTQVYHLKPLKKPSKTKDLT